MDAGVELPESGGVAAIAFELPVACSSPGKVPKRIRERLMETKSPLSVEEIEAKLREADLRRQQFHEWLSSKARPKPRSPSWSSQDEDLGQRLEAKLYAAEQKRLDILQKAQMRLARVNELRKAAKIVVEMRCEKERKELGTKVESRVKQAELNRMLLLRAKRQRRSFARERTTKSLSQRAIRESKYKERMYISICKKRAAAEKKRLGLLEAGKMRAHARVTQARRVAKSVFDQREVERRKMKDQLEDRLQRAKRQRADYLKQRGSPYSLSRVNWNKRHGDFLSRKLARCWKKFLKSRRTTLALAKAYDALGINENFIKLVPFEQLATRIESVATIQTIKALLERLETRSQLLQSSQSTLPNIDHLLKRITPPRKRGGAVNVNRNKGIKKGPEKEIKCSDLNKLRYPARVALCAYMILAHPDAVFNGRGEREVALAEAAQNFIREFELLLKIILKGPAGTSMDSSRKPSPDIMPDSYATRQWTFRSQLTAFDAAWCSYLYCFVSWKVKDARLLEEDLVRAACQLELSMMQKCKITQNGSNCSLSHDMKAIQKQVLEDQELLRDKIEHLSGSAGIERMESALLDTRSKFFEAQENGSSEMTPPVHILPSIPTSGNELFSDKRNLAQGGERSSRVVRSLFKESSSNNRTDLSASSGEEVIVDQISFTSERLSSENVVLVNEIVHEGRLPFPDNLNSKNEEHNSIKANIKQTMEKAYWDGIADAMKQGKQLDYGWLIQLVGEVRDELCVLAPQSWKEEIIGAIDTVILSQLLKSGTYDAAYFRGILEFALIKLQQLSAPAKAFEMERSHGNLLKELSDIAESSNKVESSLLTAVIKGLRFILEEIQTLKWEVSHARIEIMGSLIQGAAGFEYLRKAFADCHGLPSSAVNSLPVTVQWIRSLKNHMEQEWHEYMDSFSTLRISQGSSHSISQGLPAASALRSGGKVPSKRALNDSSEVIQPELDYPHCSGERIDVLVRLGLLKLACGIEGVTQEKVPETLKLNLTRLRDAQSQFQKIIVASTSMLILRQILLAENMITHPVDVEKIVADSVARLFELFDSSPDVGIVEITETISSLASSESGGGNTSNVKKLQARKEMMASMLLKSLRAEDAVFSKVSEAIYLAARGVVLGGCTGYGRELAERALMRVGANVLTERVVMAAKVLIRLAVVSGQVHRPWYAVLMETK